MDVQILPRVSKETKLKVREALNLDEATIKEAVETLKAWLEIQPHLPHHEDDVVLEKMLIQCKNSVEKTKKTLDMYYSLRVYYTDIMSGWDTNAPWFNEALKYGYSIPLPDLTTDLDRVVLIGYSACKIDDKYSVVDSCKLLLMGLEMRLQEDYNLKDIYVVDFKHFGLDHVKVVTFSVIKKLAACFFGGYNARTKAIHFINMPKYADVIVSITKSVLRSKLVNRMYVHGTDLTEFYKSVPQKILPKDLGGNCGTVQEHWDEWTNKMRNYREVFRKREQMKSDESRRPNREKFEHEMFGVEGSFRKLNID